jgi:hypothetical protein
MLRASADRAPDDRRSDERTRFSFAKNDDDVGFQRAMREQQSQIDKERDGRRSPVAN